MIKPTIGTHLLILLVELVLVCNTINYHVVVVCANVGRTYESYCKARHTNQNLEIYVSRET
jgi:hypothetical protein